MIDKIIDNVLIALVVITFLIMLGISTVAVAEEAPPPPEMVEQSDSSEEDSQNSLVVVNDKNRGERLIVWQ